MTHIQSVVVAALSAVGLEQLPAEGGVVGGPVTFKASDEKLFVVHGDGTVTPK